MVQSDAIKSKFVYFGQEIAFDNGFGNDFARNVVIFGVNNTAPIHNDKCKKKFSITFGKSNTNFFFEFALQW